MPNAKSKNTMGKDGFCALIFMSIAVSWWVFFVLFFAPLPNLDTSMSVLSFVVMQAVLTSAVAIFLYNNYRTPQNAILITLISQLVYYGISARSIVGILAGVVCVALLYAAITFFPHFYDRIRRKDPMEKLTYEQRLAVLRYVFKRELKNLEVHLPVQLIPSGRLLAGTLACYCPATGLVELNKWLLMQDRSNGAELCAICAHEAQHVAQVDALISLNYDEYLAMTPEERLTAKLISKEFIHYKSASKDGFDAYRNQAIERQARAYETERKKYYRKHLPAMVAAFLKHQEEKRGLGERE